MDLGYGSKGRSQPWLNACKLTCGVQVVGGLILFICASAYLFDYTKVSGQMIGGLLVAVGGIGMYGALQSSREALNLHLLGVLLAMMMAFNFIGQVVREMDVDCALAEMYVRGLATEHLIKKQHESELFNTLYTRIDEMEDMMKLMEHGAFKKLEHKKEQEDLKVIDEDYIEAKLSMLHDHAEELLKGIVDHQDVKDEKHKDWTEQEKAQLHNIVDACSRIITKVRGLDEHGNETSDAIEISYKEYEEMLSELAALFGDTEVGTLHIKGDTSSLDQALTELPNFQGALDRLGNNQYDKLKVGTVGQELDVINERAKEQSKRREEWAGDFATKLAQHKHENKMDVDLQDLPEHCLVESKARTVMTIAGFMILVAQIVSGYCVLSTLFKIPIKAE
ncbi:hypothetical protein BSKO_04263 [Bryopsis sp. KO-2023]|nr:hypothetical protein BSKO_04263 [Bryopsis sp. KO-2023]